MTAKGISLEQKTINLVAFYMLKAGIKPHFIFAFQETGILLHEGNIHEASEDSIKRWDRAIDQYNNRRLLKRSEVRTVL